MAEEVSSGKKMPKGGRKGGAVFPRYALPDAIDWARKLVSKTYLSPQPRDVIYSGVVGSRSGTGDIKISALKQYGLLEGTSKAYIASGLAKSIDASPADELPPLIIDAALRPAIFKGLFTTFQSDAVTRPKLRQRAVELKVHPDEADTCVGIYIATLSAANLVVANGDKFEHVSVASMEDVANSSVGSNADSDVEDKNEHFQNYEAQNTENFSPPSPMRRPHRGSASVTINIDSTLDTERLAKQLALLRKYDVI